MKIRPSHIIFAILTISLAAFFASRFFPKRDIDGNTPKSVAILFLKAVQAKDYSTAETFWRPQEAALIEAKTRGKFKDFCIKYFYCDAFNVKSIAKQKGGHFLVQFEGTLDGQPKAYQLYLKIIDGQWRLVIQ